jgi:hypothetical protein
MLILVTKCIDKVEHHLFKVIFIEETMKYGSIFSGFCTICCFPIVTEEDKKCNEKKKEKNPFEIGNDKFCS